MVILNIFCAGRKQVVPVERDLYPPASSRITRVALAALTLLTTTALAAIALPIVGAFLEVAAMLSFAYLIFELYRCTPVFYRGFGYVPMVVQSPPPVVYRPWNGFPSLSGGGNARSYTPAHAPSALPVVPQRVPVGVREESGSSWFGNRVDRSQAGPNNSLSGRIEAGSR